MSGPVRCERAAQETDGLWTCTRNAGHDGPCAAVAVPAVPAVPAPETFEEWRVTGQPRGLAPGVRYDFTWSPERNPHLGDAETAARHFVGIAHVTPWADGPHLSKRTVTRTAWEEVQP